MEFIYSDERLTTQMLGFGMFGPVFTHTKEIFLTKGGWSVRSATSVDRVATIWFTWLVKGLKESISQKTVANKPTLPTAPICLPVVT